MIKVKNMKKLGLINFLNILFIAILVTWYAILWGSFFRSPTLLRYADFRPFYAAGVIIDKYGYSQVYDLDLEVQVQEEVVGHSLTKEALLLYNHPPLLLPFLGLLANFQYETAYLMYSLFLYFLALLCLPFLYKILRIYNWSNSQVLPFFLGFMVFEPLFIIILKGQDSVIVLLGLIIWVTGFIFDDDRMSGLGLALTTIRPQIALFLAIPFLFRRQKVFGWFFIGAGSLVIYSYLLVGTQGFVDYLNLLRLSTSGHNYGLNLSAMFNLTGILVRAMPWIEFSPLLGILKWTFFGLSLMGMIIVWLKSAEIKLKHIAILVMCSLFFSPHLHYHDLTALLVPLIAMLLIWVDQKVISEKMSGFIMLSISVILMIGHNIDAVYFIFAYLVMIFILVGVIYPRLFIFGESSSVKLSIP